MVEYVNQSLQRGFRILEYLSRNEAGVSLAQVARATGLHRATAHRLLEVLVELGYVRKSRSDKRYWIGFFLHRFGYKGLILARIANVARPYLRRLAHEAGDTVCLGSLEGTQAVFCEKVCVARGVKIGIEVGEYFDAHATALGKSLLSLRPPNEVKHSYRHALFHRHGPRTISSLPALMKELADTRARGFAIENEEYAINVRAVASPLINPMGRAATAVVIYGPKPRFDDATIARLGRRIQEAARAIVDDLTEH